MFINLTPPGIVNGTAVDVVSWYAGRYDPRLGDLGALCLLGWALV